MRKGLLYISLPSVTSPSLQTAIDDAPRLDGADLNAPLFSGIVTNSPALSSNSAATFATSPSLFKAVLKYILNYEFDISEFLELLDTLDEVRIPRITKEENVDTFSEFRTFRAHDVTDEALGNTLGDEDHAATNTEDFNVQLTSNDLLEIAKAKDLLFVSKVTPSSFTDIFKTLVEDPLFTRITDFEDGVLPLDEFSRRATQGVDDFGGVLSYSPSIVGNTEFLGPEKASFQSLPNRRFSKVRSDIDLDSDGDILFIPGLPFDEDNNYGMTFNIKPIPDILDPVGTFSSLHTSSRSTPQSIVDRINQISVARKKPNIIPKKFWPVLNANNQQVVNDDGEPLFNLKPFWVKADDDDDRRKPEKTKDDDKLAVSSKIPYIFAGAQNSFVEKLLSESSLDDILPGKNPVELPFTESKPRKLYDTEKNDLAALKEILNSVKSRSLGEQRIVSASKTPGKKIALEFVIDETFYSIHSQLPGPVVGTPFIGSYTAVWVDLGSDYDRPVQGTAVDSNGDLVNGDGWPDGTQSFYKNARYVIIDNRYDNVGKFRENEETEIYPELSGNPRNTALASHPAYTPNSLGLPHATIERLDDIDRYDDSVKVADDAAKIWGEGGENISIFGSLPGFGGDGSFGPAPWRYKYDYAPSDTSPDRVKRWHVEKGVYYNNSYIFTETHQASGRRINLLIREMTNDDITLSNRWNGKLQISRGQTFIDRMLATTGWKNLFRYVDSIVQLNPASYHEDEITSKDLLATIAEEIELLDRVTAGFLHRFESEQLPVAEGEDIPYDVILKYFPGADRDRALVDGFREWPTYAGTEPANWEAKVLLKPMLDVFYHKASTKNVITFNKGKVTDTKTEKVKGEDERFPHHIIKKPVYFLDADNNFVDVSTIAITAENEPDVSDPALSSGDIWLQESTGKYYLFTRTFKTVIINLVPTVVVDQEFWTHVGPFEEEVHTLTGRFTASDDDPTLFNKTTVYFEFDKNLPDLDVVKSKSTKPQVFSGDALFKLDKIFGIIGVPDFDLTKQFADGAKTSEEGYFKNFTVIVVAPNQPPEGYDRDQVAFDQLLLLAPDGIRRLMTTSVEVIDSTGSTTTYRYTFSNIFFVRSRKKLAKDILLNEVAAADSGTAFVPTYCLPSYFMETYVGEDGKFANF